MSAFTVRKTVESLKHFNIDSHSFVKQFHYIETTIY